MAENTAISWAHNSWSPWEGCTKVSPGCDNCYAEAMNRWLKKGRNWGPGAPRFDYSDEHWAKPLRWNAKAEKAGKRLRVFPSVCDPFDNEVSNTLRSKFIGLMYHTPWIDWLLLTKRVGNVGSLMEECTEPGKEWELPPNAWLGSTIVNQEEADRDIIKLLQIRAKVRFLSVEPMLGPVDLTGEYFTAKLGRYPFKGVPPEGRTKLIDLLDWVIVGGESGRKARDFDIDWPRSIVSQCKEARVPVFVKQMGAKPVWHDDDEDSEPPHWGRIKFIDKSGSVPAEWPVDLRVQEFPL